MVRLSDDGADQPKNRGRSRSRSHSKTPKTRNVVQGRSNDGIKMDVYAHEDDFLSKPDYENDGLDEDLETDGEQSSPEDAGEGVGRSRSPSQTPSDMVTFRNTERELTDEEILEGNPGLQRLLERMVNKKVEAALKQKGSAGGSTVETGNSPAAAQGKTVRNRLVKSPSDTTLYTPTLCRNPVPLGTGPLVLE